MSLALLGALLVGLSLGLMGSGGSILTVPVLTYLLGLDEKVAIASSLGIVCLISSFAGIPYARRRLVDGRSLIWFGLPGMGGAYVGATLSQFVSGGVQLALFACLMLVGARLMWRPIAAGEASARAPRPALRIVVDGLVVGCLTGFVGVGGGFLIVPALVLLGGLPMLRAVGTSLFLIAMNSCTGFLEHLEVLDSLGLALDWQLIAVFASVGVLGSLAGRALGARLPQQKLRRLFALFLVLVAGWILTQSWPRAERPEPAAGERVGSAPELVPQGSLQLRL